MNTNKRVFLSGRKRLAVTGWLFALPFTILFLVSFIIPIISSIYSSFFKQKLTKGGYGPSVSVFVGVENYTKVLTDVKLWKGMLNVAEYGIIKIPLVMGLALLLAILLDSLAAKGIKFFRLAYFLPYAIPGVVAAVLWAYLYLPELSPFVSLVNFLGLPDHASRLVLNFAMTNITAWSFIGYNVIIFMATLKAVPQDLYEAARIDGASEWKIVAKIKLPMLKNAALMCVLMSIVGTVQWFNEPTIMRTLVSTMDVEYTPMMMAYNQAFNANNIGGASAISVVMAIIAGILAAIYALVQSRIGSSSK